MCGHAGAPVKGFEVMGDRADGVGGAANQVDVITAIKVNRKLGPTGGHELRQTHPPCIAAPNGQGIDAERRFIVR